MLPLPAEPEEFPPFEEAPEVRPEAPPRRRRRAPWVVLLALVALAAASWALFAHAERRGRRFFATGRGLVAVLGEIGQALQARDLAGVAEHYAPGYRGRPLGLTRLLPVDEKDGVATLRWAPAAGTADRAAALAEWRDYLARLERIEEVGVHLHRVESWSDPRDLRAVLRFELLGTSGDRPIIDRALVRARFTAAGGRPVLVEATLVEGERVAGGWPHFADVGPAAGIAFRNRYYPGFLNQPLRFGMIRYGPGGITAADFDNDGLYDLFVPDGVESRLFRNTGDGRFADVTAAAGLAGLDGASVGLFADVDGDGWRDLFVSRTFRPNQLFLSRGRDAAGQVRFADATARSGLGADCCTTVASFADYDLDGDLDLYVGRYLDPRTKIPTTFYARNGEPNQLYRNDGGGRFTNVTAAAGVGETGLGLGSVWGDYDDDGDPDLYAVNDFGRSTLYRNDGDDGSGRVAFTDVTVDAGTLAYGAGMSASFGDYDNDGRFDLYVADIRSEHAWFAEAPTVARYMANSFRQGVWRTDMPLYFEIFRQSGFGFVGVFQKMASGNTLLRNRGGGRFEDVTWDAGANPLGWFWGSGFYDFDNDGWQDIYSANGWVYGREGTEIELEFLDQVVGDQRTYKSGRLFDPASFRGRSWHGWERNRHLRNLGPGRDGRVRFREIGRAAGTDLLRNSRGIAVADFWNRGALDIAVAASADRHALLRNQLATPRNWLQVELVGTRSNRDAVGARVTARAGGITQSREVVLGDGYGSQNALRLHFGLGGAAAVDELVVRWPASGIVQRFASVAGNRIVEITEGSDRLVEKRYPARTAS